MNVPNLKNYDLLKKIASGGQGDVYLARQSNDDLGLDKTVAIKFVKKDFCSKDDFKNEVRLLSQLNHPNICKILDVGETEDSYYIVMEYVEGINLKELMTISKQKGISVPSALVYEVGKNVFSALEYAHHHNSGIILHKDISLHNIMISKSGSVVLIDFGISAINAQESKSTKGGKPSYLPKRVLTEVAGYDESVDMYSLGVVLYELLSSSRVSGEHDLKMELISDQGLKDIISKLVNFKDNYELFKQSQPPQEIADAKNIFSKIITAMIDEKVISEVTIVSRPRRKSNKSIYSSRKLGVGVLIVLLLSTGLYLGMKRPNNIDFSSTIKIVKQGEIVSPYVKGFSLRGDFKEPLRFSDVSCEMFCLQVITNLTLGHKNTYKQFRDKGMIPEYFKNDYEKYLNHTLLQYKKTQTSFYEIQNRCSARETCQYASSFSRLISQSAPLNLDQQELKKKYDLTMKGHDQLINNTVEVWNKKPLVADFIIKNFPNAQRIKSNPILNYTIYKSLDDVNEENCRLIGDFEFLNRTVDLTLPYEATINSNFNLLVFDTDVDIKRTKREISLDVGVSGKKFCSYVRESGVLKSVQIWNFNFYLEDL